MQCASLVWALIKADMLAKEAGVPLCFCSGDHLLIYDPSPCSGHLLLVLVSNWKECDGLGLPSPNNFGLKPSSPAWQAYNWRCSFPSLIGESHQPRWLKASPVVSVARHLDVAPVLYPFFNLSDSGSWQGSVFPGVSLAQESPHMSLSLPPCCRRADHLSHFKYF